MSTPEELQAELAAQKEVNAKLLADIEAAKTNNPAEALNAKIADLEKKAAEHAAESQKMRITVAKQDAVKEFPLAAGFYEQLHGGNAEEIKTNAKLFHENVVKANEVAVKLKEAEILTAWGRVTSGGTPGILRQEDLDAQMEKAKGEKDILKKASMMMGVKLTQLGMKMKGA